MRSVTYILHHLMAISIILGTFGYATFYMYHSGWWWILGFVILRTQTYTPEQWGHMYEPRIKIKGEELEKILLKD